MNSEMSGYDIKQRISMSTSNFYDASFGSIYPALKRLQADGLVASVEVIESGKLRKVYRILELGGESFLDWLQEPLIIHPSRQEWLVKVFFFRHLPKEKAVVLLKQFVKLLAEHKTKLAELEPRITEKADSFQLSTLHFGIDWYQFVLNWLQQYIKTLEEQPGQ
jgi:DNA-binding PadR family transcriptional regulator